MSQLVISATQNRSKSRDFVLILGSSLLMGLFAKIQIPLSFTPVPIALQDTIAIFLGILLGPRRGTLAVLAFLAQGALGFPVFAGGVGGIMKFIGPTGGYLIGYPLAATMI